MKVIVTIAILFSHIYGTTMDEIKVHGASAEKFRQMVFEFTDTSRIVAFDRIPFENLSNENITILKIAFDHKVDLSANHEQVNNRYPKKIYEVLHILLKNQLHALSVIEDPTFRSLKDAVSEGLLAFSQPGLWKKPEHAPANIEQPHNPDNMTRWLANWRQVMQSIDNIINLL